MASHDFSDPAVAEADRRAERAKASLRARLATLEHRLGEVRDRVNIPAQIREHPLPAVAIALALGALAGRRSASAAASDGGGRSLGASALASLGALGLRVVRELAIIQLSRAARHWLGERDAPDEGVPDEIDDSGRDATLYG
jgi:hypothetical protein